MRAVQTLKLVSTDSDAARPTIGELAPGTLFRWCNMIYLKLSPNPIFGGVIRLKGKSGPGWESMEAANFGNSEKDFEVVGRLNDSTFDGL